MSTECNPRSGMDRQSIQQDIIENLFYLQGKFPEVATRNDWYLALAYTVRNRVLHRWILSSQTYWEQKSRTVSYLSAEFLMGPQLASALVNLGIEDEARSAMSSLGLDLDDLIEQEEEPGLGNGGLGRLAACYLDSLATLRVPSIGYGIRYEFGIFDQRIRDGWQVEVADSWLRLGNPWEVARPEIRLDVKFGGQTRTCTDGAGRLQVQWIPDYVVKGTPFDTPVLGYRVGTANLLRLWKSEAVESFDLQAFNSGDYFRAVNEKVVSENITKVLYPNSEPLAGRELRLKQQYFFVSCSMQDMVRIHLQREPDLEGFHLKWAIQLNDTHPTLAIPELMRLLVDEHQISWETAWSITEQTFGYTNHTLLPEALEKWPVDMMERLLPRHVEIIYEINRRFLDRVRLEFSGDEGLVQRVSLIGEDGERSVRMAHLACVGSHAINGVAQLHTDLLKADLLKDFHRISPSKFSNKTNGVTPRRFLRLANPRLSRLITSAIGDGWLTDLDRLRDLENQASDAAFQQEWRQIKRANKEDLARLAQRSAGAALDPDTMFDVQAKRFHEYKRQHLNILHVVALYNRIRHERRSGAVPRSVLFAGKAAPGYFMAKRIIKLINAVADVVNTDPEVSGLLKVTFLPDFNVKSAQKIYPAADLSEQTSMAGKEASGTGNMKFALNGALTIGTLDGANVEIRDAVGPENFFLFGLKAEEAVARQQSGYRPREIYAADPELRQAIDAIATGVFSPGDPAMFRPIVESLLDHDPFMVLADFRSYMDCQTRAAAAYMDRAHWTQMSILNVARMGSFSSDRAIREYCEEIWKVKPVEVEMTDWDSGPDRIFVRS